MTMPEQRERAVDALEAMVVEWFKRWPSAAEGRRHLRRVMRHYPTSRHIVHLLRAEETRRTCNHKRLMAARDHNLFLCTNCNTQVDPLKTR